MASNRLGIGHGDRCIEIAQGEYWITSDWRISISTVLGSCVAVCLLDPLVGVAGMNHFLLPESPHVKGWPDARYGKDSMGMMLGALFAKGASRESLQAKVYGGASMFERGGDIGMRNVGFAIDFLEREGISIYGGCVGGTVARRIHFVPSSATVTIKTSPNFAANGPSQNTASAIRGYAA